MNRNRFLIALVSLGGLLGSAWASATASSHQKRLAEFTAQAEAARKSQKLNDRRALFGKYPTPELTLDQEVEVRPGAELTVSSGGSFVPGSLVVVPCDDVELLSSQVKDKRVEARLRVRPHALPQSCDLEVYSPVSLAHGSARALKIVGDSVWELKLANGMTTRWQVKAGETGMVGTSEWFKGGKSLGTRGVTLEPGSEGLRAGLELTEEELAAATEAQESTAQSPAQAEYNALLEKIQAECGSQPAQAQIACFQKHTAKLEALQAKLEEQGNAEQSRSVSALCDELRLEAKDGQVNGYAVKCRGSTGQVKVTGTYRTAASK